MALIFARLARNFIKAGYFPTDETTLGRILPALEADAPRLRILDPCCGEGAALAEVKRHLSECGAEVRAYGIEFDAERAWHAKTLLDVVAHSDMHDVFVSQRSVGLLFLNPPYGQAVADRAQTGDREKADRLEKIFCRKTVGMLQFGGVLVLIVPGHSIDAELANFLARHLTRVRVFRAPEQRFKQVVLFGLKRRVEAPDGATVKALEAIGRGDPPPELPEHWTEEPYRVPAMTDPQAFAFTVTRVDAAQLAQELQRYRSHTLWPQFARVFGGRVIPPRRPLAQMSPWHLALALAAGEIAGVVRAPDGRVMLVKGDTFKEKDRKVERSTDDDGNVQETVTLTDKFVPAIRAIDFTPGPGYGDIVTIR